MIPPIVKQIASTGKLHNTNPKTGNSRASSFPE